MQVNNDRAIYRPSTVQEASTNHHKTPILTDGFQTVPVVDSHPSLQDFLPVGEESVAERSCPFQESASVQPINNYALQTPQKIEASTASPKASQPLVCHPNYPLSPDACYSPDKEESASCSSAELPKRLQEFLHSIKNTELESMLDTVDNFEISGSFKSSEDYCWLNQDTTPVKLTGFHSHQRSHTEERGHTSSATLTESTGVNYLQNVEPAPCPKMNANSFSHLGLAQFHSPSQTNPQYNQYQGWTHQTGSVPINTVHDALYNAYLQPNTFCLNKNNSAYNYQPQLYTDVHPLMNTYNLVSHHMPDHRPNDVVSYPMSHSRWSNVMSHSRSSNVMSHSRRSSNVMSHSRSSNVMSHSRRSSNVMSYSRSNNVMSQPRSNNAMSPRRLDNVMSPRRLDNVMSPPISANVMSPHRSDNVMSPHRSDNVMSPPRSDNVMSQHRSNNVMSHSRSINVMSPPGWNKGTYHLPIPEVPPSDQEYSGYAQGFTCGQQLNLYL